MPLLVGLLVVAVVLALGALAAAGVLLLVLLPWLLLGLVVGWLASLVTGSRRGPLALVLVGLIGSLVGGALFTLVGARPSGGPFSPSHLLAAFVGAVLLLALFRGTKRPT